MEQLVTILPSDTSGRGQLFPHRGHFEPLRLLSGRRAQGRVLGNSKLLQGRMNQHTNLQLILSKDHGITRGRTYEVVLWIQTLILATKSGFFSLVKLYVKLTIRIEFFG